MVPLGASAVNAKWQSDAGSSQADLTGLFYGPGTGPIAGGSYCPLGLMETSAGEGLSIHLSSAVAVGGNLVYVEV